MDNTPNPPMLEEESVGIGQNLWIIGGGIALILVLLGVVGWFAISSWIGTPPEAVPVVANNNTNTVPVQQTNLTVETEGVGKTQLIDEETRRRLEEEASAALRASQSIAANEGPRVFSSTLAEHMEQMRRMRNYLFINTQTLLQGNSNKEKILADYMNTLIKENSTAKDRLAQIRTDIALLNTDYKSYQSDQKRFQDAYKQAIINYDPQGTSENLEKYIASQSMAGETYTRLKALQTLEGVYTKMLTATDTKMKFISANKEALLKEVQVVDIKSLEEKLILSEKEWLQGL